MFIYWSVHASPISPKVIVPVPEVFQPALVTVITISPPSATIIKVFMRPAVPAARVAVHAPEVEK